MSNTNEISLEIRKLIAEKAKMSVDDVTNELNLEESGLDSFARIELILAIEQQHGVEFSDSESADVSTIADIVSLIETKKAG